LLKPFSGLEEATAVVLDHMILQGYDRLMVERVFCTPEEWAELEPRREEDAYAVPWLGARIAIKEAVRHWAQRWGRREPLHPAQLRVIEEAPGRWRVLCPALGAIPEVALAQQGGRSLALATAAPLGAVPTGGLRLAPGRCCGSVFNREKPCLIDAQPARRQAAPTGEEPA
jgi:hypothetical protein